MLAKLIEAFQNQENGSPASKFDLDAFRLRLAQSLRQAFRSMDDSSKRDFLAWLGAVREIRARNDLRYSEKEAALFELKSSETVFQTMKAVLNSAVAGAPAANQQILRTGLSGIGLTTSLMKSPHLSMASALFGQALPKFLLTPQFEVVAAALEKELQEIFKELENSGK